MGIRDVIREKHAFTFMIRNIKDKEFLNLIWKM
jgi:hypothetical protein